VTRERVYETKESESAVTISLMPGIEVVVLPHIHEPVKAYDSRYCIKDTRTPLS
jgi:hypothetical protein